MQSCIKCTATAKEGKRKMDSANEFRALARCGDVAGELEKKNTPLKCDQGRVAVRLFDRQIATRNSISVLFVVTS